MNKSEQPGGASPEGSVNRNERSFKEKIKKVEGEITRNAIEGNFDAVLTFSLERSRIKEQAQLGSKDGVQEKILPEEIRVSIEEIKKRIEAIKNGSLLVDPNTKESVLENLIKRIEIEEEDLLIAEGSKPSYESQSEVLRREVNDLIEQYARRWQELMTSRDEVRILAFIGDNRRNILETSPDEAFEKAKWHAQATLAQHLDSNNIRPRDLRNTLRSVKANLETVLRRSDETPTDL